MRRALTAVLVILVLFIVHIASASIQDCTGQQCVYLPLLDKPLPPPPTRTPRPTGVQILDNHTAFVDSINYLHLVGEVANYTSNSLRFVKIAANVFNGSGQLVATDYTYIYLNSLPPNVKTCFNILMPNPAGWARYEFERPTYSTGGGVLPNIALINVSGHVNPSYHWYEIIGQARNDQGRRVEYVQPVAALYTAAGAVVGCDFTYVNSTHLDPGQTSSFSLTITERDESDVTSYRLQVDGTIK